MFTSCDVILHQMMFTSCDVILHQMMFTSCDVILHQMMFRSLDVVLTYIDDFLQLRRSLHHLDDVEQFKCSPQLDDLRANRQTTNNLSTNNLFGSWRASGRLKILFITFATPPPQLETGFAIDHCSVGTTSRQVRYILLRVIWWFYLDLILLHGRLVRNRRPHPTGLFSYVWGQVFVVTVVRSSPRSMDVSWISGLFAWSCSIVAVWIACSG